MIDRSSPSSRKSRSLRTMSRQSGSVVPLARAGRLVRAAVFASIAVNSAALASDAVAAFEGTAYLKTSNTVTYADRPYGLTRAGAQTRIDQCNAFRRMHYNLPPVSPPETMLAAVDVSVHEKYFDTNKALTLITGNNLELTDMRRWSAELSANMSSGQPPAVPPDCAQAKLMESQRGTLWRDGLVYELRYNTRKAIVRHAPAAPVAYRTADAFINAPKATELGQGCRDVVGATDTPATRHACVWDLFPYVRYLNWPFALSGRIQFGPTAAMFETIVPITVEHGRAIPASVFEIPLGFTVVSP